MLPRFPCIQKIGPGLAAVLLLFIGHGAAGPAGRGRPSAERVAAEREFYRPQKPTLERREERERLNKELGPETIDRMRDAIKRDEFGGPAELRERLVGVEPAPAPAAKPPGRDATRGSFARSPGNERKIKSIMRRDKILKTLSVRSVIELDPREPNAVEDNLKNLGVGDYQQVAESFDPCAVIKIVELLEDCEVLRLFGEDADGKGARAVGRYSFCCLSKSADGVPKGSGGFRWADARGLATPPENIRSHLALIKLPAGTKVVTGVVADNFMDNFGKYEPGGNTQIFIPHIDADKTKVIRYRLTSDADASEIALLSDKGVVLRFRLEDASAPEKTIERPTGEAVNSGGP
jgi:hypothetical protein